MPFENISNMVVTNGHRQVELDAISTFDSNYALNQVQKLLSSRAIDMGVLGIWTDDKRADVVKGEAFHDHGNEVGMLALHAQTLLALSGIEKESSIFVAPWQAHDDSYALGVRPYMDTREDAMPISLSVQALDAAVEHAVCMAVAAQGYTWEEWEARSFDPYAGERDISMEYFIYDFENNWANLMVPDANNKLVLNDPAVVIANWPMLLDREKIRTDLDAYQKIVQRSGMADDGIVPSSVIRDVLAGAKTPGLEDRQQAIMDDAREQAQQMLAQNQAEQELAAKHGKTQDEQEAPARTSRIELGR